MPYRDLSEFLKGKDTFVLTTNVDHQFRRAGFDKHRLFYTQGDYGLWQCSVPCHEKQATVPAKGETVACFIYEKTRSLQYSSESRKSAMCMVRMPR